MNLFYRFDKPLSMTPRCLGTTTVYINHPLHLAFELMHFLTTLRTDQLHTWFLAICAPQLGLPVFLHYFNDPFSWLLPSPKSGIFFFRVDCFPLLIVAFFFKTTCCICMSLVSLCYIHSILHLVKGSKRIQSRIDFPLNLLPDERSAERRE